MKTLRLYHLACGRRLADVTHPTFSGKATNPTWTPDGLCVTPRPNVDQQDYRPWPADPRADPHARTYTWRCKCGSAPIRLRHERISVMWREVSDATDPVVRLPIE